MQTFSPEQIDQLNAPLMRELVKTREQGGRKFSYVEGWHVIAECNRIFGFDGWLSETTELRCVAEKERLIGQQAKPGWGVTYIAKVRIIVLDGVVFRDGTGAGHGIDVDIGQAHESAIKEAETDARKRALMTFGNQFGLALYDKEQLHVASEADVSRQRFIDECKAKIAAFDEKDRDLILRWWHSEEQRKARRDFELNPAEVIELKALVSAKAKLPPLPLSGAP
jgi:DNA recombination protein Rad52